MKRVHTQKKSANRPFSGTQPNFRFNFANQQGDKTIDRRPNGKRAEASYKRATPLHKQ